MARSAEAVTVTLHSVPILPVPPLCLPGAAGGVCQGRGPPPGRAYFNLGQSRRRVPRPAGPTATLKATSPRRPAAVARPGAGAQLEWTADSATASESRTTQMLAEAAGKSDLLSASSQRGNVMVALTGTAPGHC